MKTAGDFVAAVAELAAGVEDGEHQGHRRDLLDGVFLDGNATTVVGDAHATVVEQGDVDLVAVAGQGLVDGVVHDLVDQVVQATFTGGPDVHARTFANSLQALQHRDLFRVVGRVGVRAAGLRHRVPLACSCVTRCSHSMKQPPGEPTACTTLEILPRNWYAASPKHPAIRPESTL